MTIRDNIVFGNAFDEKKYVENVIGRQMIDLQVAVSSMKSYLA